MDRGSWIVGLFGCVMNSEKLIWIKKTKIRLTVEKEYENYFIKTMKGGKSGSGKYYYFLLPNNKNIQVIA